MSRASLVLTVAVSMLLAPLVSHAQQPAKVFRVGWLGIVPPTPSLTRCFCLTERGSWTSPQRIAFPAMYGLREHVESSGLMAHGADLWDIAVGPPARTASSSEDRVDEAR